MHPSPVRADIISLRRIRALRRKPTKTCGSFVGMRPKVPWLDDPTRGVDTGQGQITDNLARRPTPALRLFTSSILELARRRTGSSFFARPMSRNLARDSHSS